MICPAEHLLWADAILETVANTCLQLDIPYFLAYGTCLGLYRNDRYISTDNDLDFSMVHTPESVDALSDAIQRFGFLPDIGTLWEGRHFWKHGMLIDFHWVHEESYYANHEYLWHAGYKYHIPNPIESYLEWLYGPTWRTPQEGFVQLQRGKDLQVNGWRVI